MALFDQFQPLLSLGLTEKVVLKINDDIVLLACFQIFRSVIGSDHTDYEMSEMLLKAGPQLGQIYREVREIDLEDKDEDSEEAEE